MNEQDRCVPTGDCPEGYGRADEDETGTCFPEDDLVTCEDGSVRLPQYCRENQVPPDTCEPGFGLIIGICQPMDCPDVYDPGTGPCQKPLTPTPTPATPTPPVDPSLLARSQPQCEFGVDPETGLCNKEDTFSEPLPPTPEPLPPTPEPTTTPEEEFSIEEEPEEEVEEEPEEEPEEDLEDEPEGNGESTEDSTSE
jgi:hypothetical protein